ncbi:hypothetical protein HDU88_008087 [Geranomyces variabilis]|nr:hypothetical protein HDU88_008087 [Geranomyces variabilis]
MLCRLIWRRQTQQNSQCPSPASAPSSSYQAFCVGGGQSTFTPLDLPARGRSLSTHSDPTTAVRHELPVFMNGTRDRHVSRSQSPSPFHSISPPGSPGASRTSSPHGGRRDYRSPFGQENGADARNPAPATKAFVATCGTISGHLVSNEDHREKVLSNANHLWAQLQDRLSLAGVPVDKEQLTTRRVDVNDGHSAPPDVPSRNRTLGVKERRPLRINTEIRNKPSRRAAQAANAAEAPTDFQPLKDASAKQYKRKDSGTAVHDESSPPGDKDRNGGLVAAHEGDGADGVATTTAEQHGREPSKPVSESLPVSPTRYAQPKRPAVQDIVDELESITESYDAHTSNILGLHALDGEGISTRRRKRAASESSASHRRNHRHDPQQHNHRRRHRSGPPPLFFFERAAERDVASAAYNAGLCYERALGGAMARDLVRAVVLYRQAAVAGRHPQARYNLAVLLLRKSAAGLSGPDAALRDAEEGVGWMREAAKQGFQPAVDAMEAASSFGI